MPDTSAIVSPAAERMFTAEVNEAKELTDKPFDCGGRMTRTSDGGFLSQQALNAPTTNHLLIGYLFTGGLGQSEVSYLSSVALKLEHASESTGGLVKLHAQSFCFRRSGVEPENL